MLRSKREAYGEKFMRKKLVMLTAHYPFGMAESFVEDELRAAAEVFDEIVLLSSDVEKINTGRFVPDNARVVCVRKKRMQPLAMFKAAVQTLAGGKECRRMCKDTSCSRKKAQKDLFVTNYLCACLKQAFRKERLFAADKETVFYSYWLSGGAAFLARNKKKLSGICISRAHGGDCFRDRGSHPYRKLQLEKLDAIFPISEAGRLDLIGQGGREDKVHTARLGINKESAAMNPNRKAEAYHIVTCSHVIKLKRLDLMVDALARIEDLSIRWTHFGDGDQMRQIQTYAEERLAQRQNIRYTFTGEIPKSEILKFYAAEPVDLFVNCSDAEGIPVSVMEALAYGIPAVARDVGGNSEIVQSGVNGILLPTICSAQELADAIRQILSLQEKEAEVLRTAAYETYVSKFDAKKNYAEFWEEIQQMM